MVKESSWLYYLDHKYMLDMFNNTDSAIFTSGITRGVLESFPSSSGFNKLLFASVGSSLSFGSPCMIFSKPVFQPWPGQAAPSARAQMVWPSICLLSSQIISISSGCALPSVNLHIIVFIQSIPSLQGVH